VCTKFLGLAPVWVGSVPEDRDVVRSVAARKPVVRFAAGAQASHALQAVARHVLDELARTRHRGLGARLVEVVGYSPTVS